MTLKVFLKEWVPGIAAIINSESCYCDNVQSDIAKHDPRLAQLLQEHKELGERVKLHIKTSYDTYYDVKP